MSERLFRMKPLLAEAIQWYKFGDHPNVVPTDNNEAVLYTSKAPEPEPVKPGDWIVQDVEGDIYRCTPQFFAKHFLPAEHIFAAAPRFDTFVDLLEAQDYRAVYGGYLIRGSDCFVVCDEERAIELLCLRPLKLQDALRLIQALQASEFDETKIN